MKEARFGTLRFALVLSHSDNKQVSAMDRYKISEVKI